MGSGQSAAQNSRRLNASKGNGISAILSRQQMECRAAVEEFIEFAYHSGNDTDGLRILLQNYRSRDSFMNFLQNEDVSELLFIDEVEMLMPESDNNDMKSIVKCKEMGILNSIAKYLNKIKTQTKPTVKKSERGGKFNKKMKSTALETIVEADEGDVFEDDEDDGKSDRKDADGKCLF